MKITAYLEGFVIPFILRKWIGFSKLNLAFYFSETLQYRENKLQCMSE